MTIKGKIKTIFEEKVVSEKFKTRDLVVTTNEQYPQDILIQFVQDKTSILNEYKAGDDVEVGINLRGREWVNKEGKAMYFNTIQGWKISKLDASSAPAPQTNNTFDETNDDSELDDIPF